MCNRGRILVLTVVSIFLLAGVTFAGVITLDQPNGGESWSSGNAKPIIITIDNSQIPLNAGLGQYKLWYSVDGGTNWKLITTRHCNGFRCPTKYPWEVPNVQLNGQPTSNQCLVKVKLFDMSGHSLGKDESENFFTITRYRGIVPASCGDGTTDFGEECDDGNLVNGDGCSSQCTLE